MEFWTEPQTTRRDRALGLWADYPVRSRPRVPVLIGSRIQVGEFVLGDAKGAFLDGAIEVAAEVPSAVLAALPLRREPLRTMTLTLTAAEPDTAEFDTDRGLQRFPAWRLHITGLRGGCVVLDPEVQGWWPPGLQGEQLREAGASSGHLSADGRTFTTLVGVTSPDDDPTIEFVQTDTAMLWERNTPAQRPRSGPINLARRSRQVSAPVPDALGDRVLIDWRGVPTSLDVGSDL